MFLVLFNHTGPSFCGNDLNRASVEEEEGTRQDCSLLELCFELYILFFLCFLSLNQPNIPNFDALVCMET